MHENDMRWEGSTHPVALALEAAPSLVRLPDGATTGTTRVIVTTPPLESVVRAVTLTTTGFELEKDVGVIIGAGEVLVGVTTGVLVVELELLEAVMTDDEAEVVVAIASLVVTIDEDVKDVEPNWESEEVGKLTEMELSVELSARKKNC